MSKSVLFWNLRISLKATVPGRYLWGFFTPPATGADFRAAFVASCLRGALPPVDFLAVCFVRAMMPVDARRKPGKNTKFRWVQKDINEQEGINTPQKTYILPAAMLLGWPGATQQHAACRSVARMISPVNNTKRRQWIVGNCKLDVFPKHCQTNILFCCSGCSYCSGGPPQSWAAQVNDNSTLNTTRGNYSN